MMFTPRTTPVAVGTKPYAWNVSSQYECTWFCYYRAQEAMPSATPCTYWDRATKTGSYTNAKDWLANYRDPWEVKNFDYTPVAGDIAVFDGEYGHVQFMETDTMFSEYSSGDPNSFRNGKFEKKSNLLGFLHYPYDVLQPVGRNAAVNQIKTTDATLRIRTEPSLDADVVGHVQIGFYNVLATKKADGYTWYKLANNRWCANLTTVFLPAEEDVVRQIEEYISNLKEQTMSVINENNDLKADMADIRKISEKWAG